MRKSGKFLGCCLITVSLLACTACSGFDRLSDNLKDGAEQLSDDVVSEKATPLSPLTSPLRAVVLRITMLSKLLMTLL